MVHSSWLPEASRMAVVTVGLNRNVAGRTPRLRTIAGASVAQITLEWRSYELPVDVTALAGDALVLSGQWEPREIMIKGRRRLCGCDTGQQHADSARKQQPGETWKRL